MFHISEAFFWGLSPKISAPDPDVPHGLGTCSDSMRPKAGSLLRSELLTIVSVLKAQNWKWEAYTKHAVLPVGLPRSFDREVVLTNIPGSRHELPRPILSSRSPGLRASRADHGSSLTLAELLHFGHFCGHPPRDAMDQLHSGRQHKKSNTNFSAHGPASERCRDGGDWSWAALPGGLSGG